MPASGEAASYGDLLVTSLLVLGGVCVAAFVVVRVLGRFLATGSRRGAHLLDIVARMPLEPRRSLYVVDVAGKTLLVGTSEMGLSVLTELDRDAVHARVVERPTFAELVRTAWAKRKSRSAGGVAAAEPGSSKRGSRESVDASASSNVNANETASSAARGADAAGATNGSAGEVAMANAAIGTPAAGASANDDPPTGSTGTATGERSSSPEPGESA